MRATSQVGTYFKTLKKHLGYQRGGTSMTMMWQAYSGGPHLELGAGGAGELADSRRARRGRARHDGALLAVAAQVEIESKT